MTTTLWIVAILWALVDLLFAIKVFIWRDGFKSANKLWRDLALARSPLTVKNVQREAYDIAKDHGWVDKDVDIPEMIALIHSEASEALESYRNNEPLSYTQCNGKPEGVGPEFADVVIRIAHYCELLGLDLETELKRKMKYNSTRPYRHEGKKI